MLWGRGVPGQGVLQVPLEPHGYPQLEHPLPRTRDVGEAAAALSFKGPHSHCRGLGRAWPCASCKAAVPSPTHWGEQVRRVITCPGADRGQHHSRNCLPCSPLAQGFPNLQHPCSAPAKGQAASIPATGTGGTNRYPEPAAAAPGTVQRPSPRTGLIPATRQPLPGPHVVQRDIGSAAPLRIPWRQFRPT